jgi:hypothetical protein
MVSAKTAEFREAPSSREEFWSYWYPLGIFEGSWEEVEFIFFDEGRIHAETLSFRHFTKEEFDAIPMLDE